MPVLNSTDFNEAVTAQLTVAVFKKQEIIKGTAICLRNVLDLFLMQWLIH